MSENLSYSKEYTDDGFGETADVLSDGFDAIPDPEDDGFGAVTASQEIPDTELYDGRDGPTRQSPTSEQEHPYDQGA